MVRIRRLVDEAGISALPMRSSSTAAWKARNGIGVRELAARRPSTPTSVFRTLSVSKTFTAQLVATLADEGRPTGQFPLPRSRRNSGSAAASSVIRLQHVIGQSSGLVLERVRQSRRRRAVAAADPAAVPDAPEPSCAPQCYGYQNIPLRPVRAGDRAGVRRRCGDRSRSVLEPLGMEHASVGRTFFAAPDRASLHVRRDGGWQRVEVEPNYHQLPVAAAGVNASAKRPGAWLIAQMGGFRRPCAADVAMLAARDDAAC